MSVSEPTVLVIIPTYNERENLPVVTEGLMRHSNVRLLVVDDQSPDGTAVVADDLARKYPGRVDVMVRKGRRGLGRAYIDGFGAALATSADLICQMDADLSHDPAELPTLTGAAAAADLVIGSRYVPHGTIVNWPLRRLLLSRFANWYVRTVTRLQACDCTSGYRCSRRATLARLLPDGISSDGYAFLVETLFIAAQGGARVVEVPITFVERRQGQSKLSRAVLLESVLMPWRMTARPRSDGLEQRGPDPGGHDETDDESRVIPAVRAGDNTGIRTGPLI
jgi:dolichol-phosphate mannosyltransferase